MQRNKRSNAGNIYKKRLEEILDVPRANFNAKLKSTISKTPKKTAKQEVKVAASPPAKRPVSRGSKTSSVTPRRNDNGDNMGSDEYNDLDITTEIPPDSEEDSNNPEMAPRSSRAASFQNSSGSSSASTPASRANLRIQKRLANKFKCPHCKAMFAEKRYVEFHCKEVHRKTSTQQEKKVPNFPVRESGKTAFVNRLTENKIHHQDPDEGVEDTYNEDQLSELAVDALANFGMSSVYVAQEEEQIQDCIETLYAGKDGESIMYKCKNCPNFQVSSKHVIVAHAQRHLSHRCPYCSFKGNNRASLEVHMFNHTGLKPFCCKVCDLSFKCTADMLEHCNSGHSQNEIRAETLATSPQKTKRIGNRKPRGILPSESLSPQSQHKCPYCPERFMSVVNLKTHINIHRIKGTTDEDAELEIESSVAFEEEDDMNYSNPYRDPPSGTRAKRKLPIDLLPAPAKLKKENEVSTEEDNTTQIRRSAMAEGPPRCKICSKVFLYTTQIDRHMRDVHNIQDPNVPNLTSVTAKKLGGTPLPDLTPIITSVVSQAVPGTSAASKMDENENQPTSTTQSTGIRSQIQKSQNQPVVANSVKGSTKTPDPNAKPIKSVYLLLDPTNNTCIPVDTSIIDFKGTVEKSRPTSNSSTSSNKLNSSKESLPDNSDGDEQTEVDSRIDTELEAELLKIGKPGMPVVHSADNQNIEHQCAVCQERIVGYTEIVKHFHTHTMGTDSICHICNKRFSSKSSLGAHFLTHIGISYSCPICQTKLAKKQSLLEHIRFHRGERRHICQQCNKAFLTSSSLNRHMKMHTGNTANGTEEKTTSLKCPHCPRTCPDAESFAKHERAHEIINGHGQSNSKLNKSQATIPISCQYCGKLWASVVGLTRHLKSAHADILAQAPPSSNNRIMRNSLPMSFVQIVPQMQSTSEVIVTEAEPNTMKIIDVIDLSGEEQEEEDVAVIEDLIEGPGTVDSQIEIPIGTIVNVDGQDVDAIEVVTSEVLEESTLNTDPSSTNSPVVESDPSKPEVDIPAAIPAPAVQASESHIAVELNSEPSEHK